MPLKPSDQQRNEIIYEQFKPINKITKYVDRILYGYAPPDIDHQIAIPPSGGVFISYVIGSPLSVRFNDRVYEEKPRIFLGGQLKTEAPILIPESDFGLIGFQLKPTGFYKLFGLDADKFTDDIRDFMDVDEAGCSLILKKITSRASKEDVINAVSDYIQNKQAPDVDSSTVEDVINEIIASQGIVRIKDLAEKYNLPTRKLSSEFLKKVGLSPKYFAKVIQFNTVSELLSKGQKAKLNKIALDCGYFDQSHFIKDFQKYLGMNPMSFVKSEDRFLSTFLARIRD